MDKTRQERYNMIYGNTARKIEDLAAEPVRRQPRKTRPRRDHKYISSFLGFAPADNPQVLVLVVINNPQGIYYGGTIAAPVAKEIFENILPYLDK